MGILLLLCRKRLRNVFLQAMDDETHGKTSRLFAGTTKKARRKIKDRKPLIVSYVYIPRVCFKKISPSRVTFILI